MQTVNPISDAARCRAEQADPNGQRCLVENCPAERAVQLAHVFDRERSGNAGIMASIEWAWGMRKGTLNLDTRRNVFFLGASMLSLYKSGKWALLPAEELVDRYLEKPRGRYLGVPLSREHFPSIEGQTFEYRLLPLCNMSAFGITRQNEQCDPSSTDAYRTHVYPFDTLPAMTSHVHPNFVLLHLSRLLFNRGGRDPYIANLLRTNTHIAKVARLSVQWCSPHIPSAAKYDKTFVSVCAPRRENSDDDSYDAQDIGFEVEELEDAEEDLDYQSSDGDSICTPPHRIRYTQTPSHTHVPVQSAKRPSDVLEEPDGEHEQGNKRRKVRKAAGEGDEEGNKEFESDSGNPWTKEAISSWALKCSASAESPDSPAPTSEATDCT